MPDRSTRSCDSCKVRKIRCRRESQLEIANSFAKEPCTNCRKWSQPCSYLQERKRRGKQAELLKSLQEVQSQRIDRGDQSGLNVGLPITNDPRTRGNPNGIFTTDTPPVADQSLSDLLANPSADPVTDPGGPLLPIESLDVFSFLRDDPPLLTPTARISTWVPTDSLNGVINRDSAFRILSLFFNHVCGIIPIIHRPTFLADFEGERDREDSTFLAMVLAVIATTLVHVPKAFVPDIDMLGLSRGSITACEEIIRGLTQPGIELVCIKYLCLVVHIKHGDTVSATLVKGELTSIVIDLGLHLESTYATLSKVTCHLAYAADPIEAERGRRVWFLVHNADKFDAVASNQPIIFRSDEFRSHLSTKLPAEIEDDYITAEAYMPSPDEVAVVAGLNLLTRTVTVLGDILLSERKDLWQPTTTSEEILSRLQTARTYSMVIQNIIAALQAPFAMESTGVAEEGTLGLRPGWQSSMVNNITRLVRDPSAFVAPDRRDVFRVLKANIHVTLAVTRMRLILYRETLLNLYGPPGHPDRALAELLSATLGGVSDSRSEIYKSLLEVLHSIPLQALILNGPSLVAKLRLVASTLLDAALSPDVQQSQELRYLLEFLDILTSIEQEDPVITNDDESGPPSC